MNMKWLAVPALGLGLVLTGCHQSQAGAAAAATSGAAKASAFATSTAGQYDVEVAKSMVVGCTPKTPVAQLTWLHNMARQNLAGTETRQAFASCTGIPHQKMKAFENEALAGGEHALSQRVIHHQKGALATYLDTDLPKLVVKYRG